MNALIQGSAARHTKLWMRACWREGIVPLLQMHDALDCSVASREQAEVVAQLGREAVKLEVPIQVDLKYGCSWGDATDTWDELHSIPKTKSPPIDVAEPVSEPPPESKPAVDPVAINGFHALPEATDGIAVIEGPGPELPWRSIPLADLIGEKLTNGKICCPYHDDDRP